MQRYWAYTPKGIEKILVDVIADKLIGIIVPEGEKNTIIEEACSCYFIDDGTMMRYAKRKGAVRKLTSKMEEIRWNKSNDLKGNSLI